jgi:hypothetical protein
LIELGTPAAALTSVTTDGPKATILDLPAATYADGSPLPPNKTVVACDITPRTDGQAGSYILVKVQVDGVTLTDGFSIPITIIDNSAPGLTGYPLYHFVNGAWKILVTLPPDLSDPTGCTYSGLLTENQDYAGLSPPADVPGAPAKPTTVAQVGAITVNYSAPEHTGGSAITSYRIYWSGANATSGDITTTGPVTSATVTNLIANTNIIFDCLSKGSTSHISEKIKQLCAHYQGDEDNVMPLFMELKQHDTQASHAILSLLFPKNGKIFFYDLLNGKCGQITLENATFEKTISVWGMVEPFTNSLLGINISELKHLIQ